MANHPLRATWSTMLQRCTNPNNAAFKYYGGRGIRVCKQWLVFKNFVADIEASLGPRPDGKFPSGVPKYSLHRIRNHGNYEPGNVEWATAKKQTAPENRRKRPLGLIHKNSVVVGDVNLKEACRRAGVSNKDARNYTRIKGCTPLEAIALCEERRRLGTKKKHTRTFIGGLTLPVACRLAGVSVDCVRRRIYHLGETAEQAIAYFEERRRRGILTHAPIKVGSVPLVDACRLVGVNSASARSRMYRYGETPEQAIAHLRKRKSATDGELLARRSNAQ